ncbi:GIY-YIG nuclease family protein [bacterium]|nr:GIY-YIG nuclease family protein [bacterium]
MTLSPKFQTKLDNLPTTAGCYLYYNSKHKVIYVGKAKNLKNRVSSYFVDTFKGPKTEALVAQIVDLDIIQVRSEIEAFLLEADLIKRYKPHYNIDLKDDKSYKYIAVQDFDAIVEGKKYTFSKIFGVHGKNLKRTRYYGPYPDGSLVVKVLKYLRRIYPHCEYTKGKLIQSLKQKRACLYSHIGLCPGACGDISKFSENRKNIFGLEEFLKKGYTKAIEDLEKEMRRLSLSEEYEKAKEIRDTLEKLQQLETASILPEQYVDNPNLLSDIYKRRADDIAHFFDLPSAQRIECYDISNMMEQWTVGSMVVSEGGQLAKDQYRKFKIKYTKGISDFWMMKEILSRRLKNGWRLPDILLIDGGKGQVGAVLDAIIGTPFEQIPVIGIFKPNDYFVRKVDGKWKVTKVEKNNIGYLHLRELRDEAHRFANKYRKKLMAKEFSEKIEK